MQCHDVRTNDRALFCDERFLTAVHTLLGDGQIFRVDVDTNKARDTAALRGNGRVAYANEWIEHRQFGISAVRLDAALGELNWERRRMRALIRTALDRF